MYHGIINVYKERGFTSHDVVAKLRGIAGQKKIGHTGTLDPDAEGVLPVCLGAATKLCDMLTDKSKEYVAVLKLGIVTDTQDTTGTVLEQHQVQVTEAQIEQAMRRFVGTYDQIPPMYSAIKVNGKKLYELAREGKVVERKARPVEIYYIDILEPYQESTNEIKIRVGCSKGTYIRTLCHDIGAALGCGGAMAYLQRTKVGAFTVEKAYTLAQLQDMKEHGTLDSAVTPVEDFFAHLPKVVVKDQARKLVQNGNVLPEAALMQSESDWIFPGKGGADEPNHADIRKQCEDASEQTEESLDRKKMEALNTDEAMEKGWFRVYDSENRFYGIYKYIEEDHLFKPEKMFFL